MELPSNKKFGLFFAALFSLAFIYCVFKGYALVATVCIVMACLTAYLAIFKPDSLLPFNKTWMKFGLLLGMIVSPIVIGLIFFIIFTPIGVLMRLFGRDELRLKPAKSNTHWKIRNQSDASDQSLNHQF